MPLTNYQLLKKLQKLTPEDLKKKVVILIGDEFFNAAGTGEAKNEICLEDGRLYIHAEKDLFITYHRRSQK